MKTNSQLPIGINSGAPVVCCRSIQIDTDIRNVWSTLTDINRWSSWQKDIKKSSMDTSLALQTSFIWFSGGARIRSTVHTLEPFKSFGWTGRSLGVFAIHNWTLRKENGTTRVLVEESMEGTLARLLSKSLRNKLEQGMQTWLELLKTECETKNQIS